MIMATPPCHNTPASFNGFPSLHNSMQTMQFLQNVQDSQNMPSLQSSSYNDLVSSLLTKIQRRQAQDSHCSNFPPSKASLSSSPTQPFYDTLDCDRGVSALVLQDLRQPQSLGSPPSGLSGPLGPSESWFSDLTPYTGRFNGEATHLSASNSNLDPLTMAALMRVLQREASIRSSLDSGSLSLSSNPVTSPLPCDNSAPFQNLSQSTQGDELKIITRLLSANDTNNLDSKLCKANSSSSSNPASTTSLNLAHSPDISDRKRSFTISAFSSPNHIVSAHQNRILPPTLLALGGALSNTVAQLQQLQPYREAAGKQYSSKQHNDEILSLNISKPHPAHSKEQILSLTTDSDLVCPDIYGNVPDSLFLAMAQMKVCALTVGDLQGKCKSRQIGESGLCCKYCDGMPGSGRYFPSTLDSFLNGTNGEKIVEHAGFACHKCPVPIQKLIQELFVWEQSQDMRKPYGSRKRFFTQAWTQLSLKNDKLRYFDTCKRQRLL